MFEGLEGMVDTSRPSQDIERSWSFYIAPVSADSCRLLLRGCFKETRKRSWSHRAAFALEQPVDFVMEQRMLRTIKRLAESSAASASAASENDNSLE